jgi:hypothetical protein
VNAILSEPMTTKAAIETPVKRKEAPEAQGIGKLARYPSPTFAPIPPCRVVAALPPAIWC